MQQIAAFNPLASPHWHRVADTRPRLAAQVRTVRQWVRGQRWYVLQDPLTGHSCRLNAAAYAIAARLDGQRSLHDLWQTLDAAHLAAAAHAALAEPEPPTQDEVLQVLAQLQQQGLVQFDGAPDFGTLAAPPGDTHPGAATPQDPSDRAVPGQPPRQSLLAWRLPLLDPQAWLTRGQALAQAVFSRWGLGLWCALMLLMAGLLVVQAEALQAHAARWMGSPRYLLLATLCYPVIKAIHEAAHALAVQRWGGAVHEAGLTFMMLVPVPYVDASAAHGFAQVHQRALVSAAGIMAELAVAAIGLWCWASVDVGWARDLGFVLWFIGCLSTLLFNANPLQRLDGYHLLTDLFGLPNLATRSQQWWHRHVQGWLAGPDGSAPRDLAFPVAPGERGWLIAYAPLAWLYQSALWSGMAWQLGRVGGAPLAWAALALVAWQFACRPAWRWLGLCWSTWVWASSAATAQRAGVARRLACVLALPLAVCLPWPDSTVVQGLVWPPDEALVRPEVDGFVAGVHQADGAMVQAGTPLITLSNPKLNAEHARVAALLAQAEQGSFGFAGSDSAGAGQATDQAERWQRELDRIDAQLAALTVRAHHAGRLVLPQAADLAGRYVRRGELLGHVLGGQAPTVRVAVAEDEVGRWRAEGRAVSVRLSAPDSPVLPARWWRDSVGATQTLPSAALSQDMGGQVQTDPKDEHHLRTLRPVVLMDLQVQADPRWQTQGRLGERVWVRVDQGHHSLPWQLWRTLARRALNDFKAGPMAPPK